LELTISVTSPSFDFGTIPLDNSHWKTAESQVLDQSPRTHSKKMLATSSNRILNRNALYGPTRNVDGDNLALK
jgi:hypothetical protein